jgi:lysophospholipase L1-like esterase
VTAHRTARLVALVALVLALVAAVLVVRDAVRPPPSAGSPGRASETGGGRRTDGTASATPSSPTTVASPAAALRVVGLGDSVPAADTCGCDGYLEQLVPDLRDATGRPVGLRNDAVGGWTTQDVLADLTEGRSHDDLVSGADLVVVEIGANDFDLQRLSDASCAPAGTSACFRSTLAGLRSGLTEVVKRVRSLAPGARVALLGYWNVGVDGAVGRSRGSTYVTSSDDLTRAVNGVVESVASGTGATYVDAYTPLKGTAGTRDPTEDLLDDGDHPNATGHRRLADAVLDALQGSGAVRAWAA